MSGEHSVVYMNHRWWRTSTRAANVKVVLSDGSSFHVGQIGNLELITPRGHDGTDRHACAAHGCYLCRAVLTEQAARDRDTAAAALNAKGR